MRRCPGLVRGCLFVPGRARMGSWRLGRREGGYRRRPQRRASRGRHRRATACGGGGKLGGRRGRRVPRPPGGRRERTCRRRAKPTRAIVGGKPGCDAPDRRAQLRNGRAGGRGSRWVRRPRATRGRDRRGTTSREGGRPRRPLRRKGHGPDPRPGTGPRRSGRRRDLGCIHRHRSATFRTLLADIRHFGALAVRIRRLAHPDNVEASIASGPASRAKPCASSRSCAPFAQVVMVDLQPHLRLAQARYEK